MSLRVQRSFPTPGPHPCGLDWDGNSLWYSDGDTNRLYRLSSTDGSVLQDFPCPDVRTDLAFDGARLWQIAGRPKQLRIIETSGQLVREIPLGPDSENACGIAVRGDRYYVGWKTVGRIEFRSVADSRVLGSYPALARLAGMTLVGTGLWYTEYEKSLLVGLDSETGKELQRFSLEGNPTGLCWDGSRFLYNDYTGRRICMITPQQI